MVLTRRQNGVTPKASSALKRSLDVAEASENEYNSEDDYKESKVVKAPNAKRRKTTQTTAPKASSSNGKVNAKVAAAKPKRRGNDLSLLPTMPLDILFEILGQLGPKDLLSLSRTNKLWRRTVVSPETEFLWRSTREAFRAPEPPEDFTEQRWAGLLFETTCQSCGKKGAGVDWLLLRRACATCKRAKLMYAPKFKSMFPEDDKAILDYVPHTTTGLSTRQFWRRPAKASKFYWFDDIESAIEEMSELRGKKLEEWKTERKEDIEERAKMASKYEDWVKYMDQLNRDDARANRGARLKAATQRFVEAGYELTDIKSAISASSEGLRTGVPYITNAVWTKIRPALEDSVIKARNRRLAAELQPTVNKRMKILSQLYGDHLDLNLRPSERYYCPPVEVFRPIPEVMALVEAALDTTIDTQAFQPIAEKFAQYIGDYQETRKNFIETLVPPARRSKTDQRSFNLAQNVFRRGSEGGYYYNRYHYYHQAEDNVLIGWSMLGTHQSSNKERLELRPGVYLNMPESFMYNLRASECSLKLITLAGLDPATATVEDMDAVDKRFVYENFSAAVGYPVFNWRGAIAIDNKGDGYIIQSVRLATREEEEEAKANEDALRAMAKAWSCNHCTRFLESGWDTRTVLIEHIQDEHGISDPQPIKDYFMNERCRHIFEKPYEIVVPDVQKYKCKCSECERFGYRAFSKEQLDVHLKRVFPYSYSPPVAGTSYWPVPSGHDARAKEAESV